MYCKKSNNYRQQSKVKHPKYISKSVFNTAVEGILSAWQNCTLVILVHTVQDSDQSLIYIVVG
jgi:hypothetical protein